ncbi:hypothetical protein U1Q18_002964, partial [Sarracenia purpurea var. burkii]
ERERERERERENSKDDGGNKILHLTVADKQIEIKKILKMETRINVNAQSATSTVATDIVPDDETPMMTASRASPSTSNNDTSTVVKRKGKKKKRTKSHGNWLDKTKNTLMVVASLIATMAFQVGVNPPSSVWQDSSEDNLTANSVNLAPNSHIAGFSIMAYNYPSSYKLFLISNTTGFIASLSIILILVSGLPLRWRVIMWVLKVIMWIALTAMSLTYLISLTVIAPNDEYIILTKVLEVVIAIWIVVILLLLLGHAIRLLVKIIRLIVKSLWKLIKLSWKK